MVEIASHNRLRKKVIFIDFIRRRAIRSLHNTLPHPPIAPTEGVTLRALAAAAAALHSCSSSQATAAALPSSSPAALAEFAATTHPPEASQLCPTPPLTLSRPRSRKPCSWDDG